MSKTAMISIEIDPNTIALARKLLLAKGHVHTEMDLSDDDIIIILTAGRLADSYPQSAQDANILAIMR